MIKTNVTTEVSPIVGSEKQSEELVNYFLENGTSDQKFIEDMKLELAKLRMLKLSDAEKAFMKKNLPTNLYPSVSAITIDIFSKRNFKTILEISKNFLPTK